MNKKFILGIAAAAAIAVGSFTASAAGFAKTNTYTPGMFSDVPASEWYASSVSSSYELGFMKGTADGVFSPEGNMTVAEAITIAARVHDAYNAKGTAFSQNGANWYDEYVKYAIDNGIIKADAFDDYERPVKRYEMAVIFSKAVPDDYLEAKNNVTEIPDVPNTNGYFDRLQLLYNAGVVMGNDEFGTFMPNNNIIRAEAAAIIGRIALPENRLQKTLVDANYDDAYYLVNSANGLDLAGSANQYDTPWQYDNRNRNGAISNSAGHVADYYLDGKVELWRDLDDVSRGLVGWDFYGSVASVEDGVYFKLVDDDLNEVAALTTKGGKYFMNGTDTGIETKNGSLYFTMQVDLDANTVALYMNGAKVGDYAAGDYTVSRVYIGSGKETIGSVTITRTDIYKDYLVNEIFLVPADGALSQWEVSGTGKVVKKGGQGYSDTNSAELSAGSVAKKSFKPVSGSVVYEAYMLFPTANDTGYISLNSGDTSVAKLTLDANGVYAPDGTKLRHHTNNIWQTLRIEADTVNGTVLYKVNGKKVGEFALSAALPTVDNITVANTSGTVFFDDAKVFLTHDHDDYCPVPKPITDDGYDVLLNVCSLWREGTHFGWGAVTAFPDIEPALGYYDEGIPEVADWEIKFMVENGIDVQHFCWYCPSSNQLEPIKRSSLNFALHDGFFNAEYSDLMKFTFMWENSGVNTTNLEDFKTYIWSYWMDYYFLDNRFYTIDNKLVFTAWSYTNFKKAFGGTNEGAQEAVKFMNDDAKAHGFDGIMLFFADGHAQDAGSFSNMAALGATASYAYHWNQDGNNADKTITRLQRNQDYGKLYIVPTVSVGFNNIGWSGVRKPLASLEDHKKVLNYIKNDYLTKQEGWKAKTLIVSTWNEYGEGTYVMPCKGLHGFGYLENVAEVISGVTDHSTNIYPTDNQKARLGHLYPKSKTSIKQWDYEEETGNVPQKALFTFTGDNLAAGQNIDDSKVENGIIKVTTAKSDPGLKVKGDMPEIKAEDIIQIRVTAKSNVDSTMEIFYTTSSSPNLEQDKSFNAKVTKSDDFKEYVINTASKASWKDTITFFRFDIISGAGEFEVSKIELLGYDESQLPITVTIDQKEYASPFHPILKNDELYVPASSIHGFFSLNNFYYEWSRYTGKLRIITKKDHEIIFNIDSDVALVDGKETKLAEKVTLRDGLPVLPLFFIYKIEGTNYTFENKAVTVSTLDKKYQDIIDQRVAYQYEFNVPGDLEGFTCSFATGIVKDGFLSGDAVERPGQNPAYDPMLSLGNLSINTLTCNKIIVGMKHKFLDGIEKSGIEIFFATDKSPSLSQDKSAYAAITGNSSGDKVIEYVLDFSENESWTGTVTNIRFDPMSCGGHFDIDYIRFVMDEDMAKENEAKIEEEKKKDEEKLAKGILVENGDAEDAANNKAFFSDNATIQIANDKEKGNVWEVIPNEGNVWAYMRQKVTYQTGVKYKASLDVKLTGTLATDKDITTTIYCNLRYMDAEGKEDHISFAGGSLGLSTEDGWKHWEFEFEIPASSTFRGNDQFSFYTNPTDGAGVGYMIDNLSVQKAQ